MDVVIVRHAVAEKRDADRWPDDSRRPLTAASEARFARAARGLAVLVPRVDMLLASPYDRAWRTGELLNEVAGWPAPERCPELEAERAPEDALEALGRSEGHECVAVVGHEPMLSEVVSLLLTGNAAAARVELKKGAAALVAFTASPRAGEGLLRFVVQPRALRALAGGS